MCARPVSGLGERALATVRDVFGAGLSVFRIQ
jgi:hypothetical protein